MVIVFVIVMTKLHLTESWKQKFKKEKSKQVQRKSGLFIEPKIISLSQRALQSVIYESSDFVN